MTGRGWEVRRTSALSAALAVAALRRLPECGLGGPVRRGFSRGLVGWSRRDLDKKHIRCGRHARGHTVGASRIEGDLAGPQTPPPGSLSSRKDAGERRFRLRRRHRARGALRGQRGLRAGGHRPRYRPGARRYRAGVESASQERRRSAAREPCLRPARRAYPTARFGDGLLESFHVVRAPDGGMFMDIFARKAFLYRVLELEDPARLVVDFKPKEVT